MVGLGGNRDSICFVSLLNKSGSFKKDMGLGRNRESACRTGGSRLMHIIEGGGEVTTNPTLSLLGVHRGVS